MMGDWDRLSIDAAQSDGEHYSINAVANERYSDIQPSENSASDGAEDVDKREYEGCEQEEEHEPEAEWGFREHEAVEERIDRHEYDIYTYAISENVSEDRRRDEEEEYREKDLNNASCRRQSPASIGGDIAQGEDQIEQTDSTDTSCKDVSENG